MSDRIERLQQVASDRRDRRQQAWRYSRDSQRRVWPDTRTERRSRDHRGYEWRDDRRRGDDDGDWGRNRRARSWGLGDYFGYKNYGQYRSAQVRARNEARKADRYWDRYSRSYDRYDRYYDYDDYDTRYSVIRNIVRTRIYDSYYDDSYYHPNYSSYYYNTPYEPVYGSPYVDNCAYFGIPTGYYQPQVSYVSVPQYGNTYYDPYYADAGYSRYDATPSYADHGYYPTNYDYGYSDSYYEPASYESNPYLGILSQLPVGELLSEFAGNGFLGDLLGGFLNQGYDQGYIDAQYAREYGYDESTYYDPYARNDTGYNTFSVNLAENRRIFSEGYEAGYRDAMMARDDEYSPYQDSQPDLIGLLVGTVLSEI